MNRSSAIRVFSPLSSLVHVNKLVQFSQTPKLFVYGGNLSKHMVYTPGLSWKPSWAGMLCTLGCSKIPQLCRVHTSPEHSTFYKDLILLLPPRVYGGKHPTNNDHMHREQTISKHRLGWFWVVHSYHSWSWKVQCYWFFCRSAFTLKQLWEYCFVPTAESTCLNEDITRSQSTWCGSDELLLDVSVSFICVHQWLSTSFNELLNWKLKRKVTLITARNKNDNSNDTFPWLPFSFTSPWLLYFSLTHFLPASPCFTVPLCLCSPANHCGFSGIPVAESSCALYHP